MGSSKDIRSKLERLQGAKFKIQKDIEITTTELTEEKRNLRRHQQAKEIVKQVGFQTQQQLEFHISNIVSLALESVFDNPYLFKTQFIERRNKIECDLLFERNGHTIHPVDDAGIGACDVAGFALLLASWSMENPRSRPVFILDEPFKHLKGFEENVRVISMVKELSKKLNLQIIMVHDERVPLEEIEKGADKVFDVKIHKDISKITEK